MPRIEPFLVACLIGLGACGKPAPPATDVMSQAPATASNTAAIDPSAPSSEPEPPRAMRGIFTMAPDRETFQECGKSTVWWLAADAGTLQPLRQRAAAKAETTHTPAPSIYVELTGELLGTQHSAGFANDYRNVVKLSSVTRLSDAIPVACVAN